MSGDIECGNCDMCNNQAPLSRKYYIYDIKCECCDGKDDDHFEIVRYCSECEPKPPKTVKVVITPKG